MIKHSYQALEPDELTLDIGDVVNVLKKMKDDGELDENFLNHENIKNLLFLMQVGTTASASEMEHKAGSQETTQKKFTRLMFARGT